MTSTYTKFFAEDLRHRLPKIKKQIALGLKRLVLVKDGNIVAFLVPLTDVPGNLLPPPDRKTTTVSRLREDFDAHLPWLEEARVYNVSLIEGQPAWIALCAPNMKCALPIPKYQPSAN